MRDTRFVAKLLKQGFGGLAMALALFAVATPVQAIIINSAVAFSSLDGSVDDEDGLADGIFTRLGDLQLTSGGSIFFNDPAAPANNSAGNMAFSVGGNFNLFAGSSLFAENRVAGGSGGNIDINVGGNLFLQGTINATPGAIISSSKNAGTGGTGTAGDININVTGNILTEVGSQIRANSTTSAGAINMTGDHIFIDGDVLSQGQITGVGINQPPGGGPIFIIGDCELTIGPNGVVSSRGRDPGADLVHLEACDVYVYGLVESTGPGHVVPTNPPTLLNNTFRPDKPANSTGGVEIWAGNNIVIDSTGANNGEVNADIGITGGTTGRGYIDLIAKNNIFIFGDSSGAFAVHANGGLQQNTDDGGLIKLQTLAGDVVAFGLALQADATSAGSDGGEILIEAFRNALLDGATLYARGDFNGTGGFGDGGEIEIRAFNGDIFWTNGLGDVRPNHVAAGFNPGSIMLIYANALGIGGSSFPSSSAAVFVPTNAFIPGPNSPVLQSYVQLNDCECLIPEPGTGSLAVLGWGAVLWFRRRRQ